MRHPDLVQDQNFELQQYPNQLDNQLCIYQRRSRKIILEFKKYIRTRSKLVKLEDFVDTFNIEVNHDVVFFDETKDT